MTKISANDSEIIKLYLQQIENTHMLTKQEELAIGKSIKEIENKIIKSCLKFPLFKEELLKLEVAVNRNISNVVKYSKNLIQDSPKNLKEGVRSEFIILFDAIRANNISVIKKSIDNINFTSSLINQLTKSMKELDKKVKSYEFLANKTYEFLEVTGEKEYNELVNKCRNDEFRLSLAHKLYTTNEILVKYLTRQEDRIKFYNENNLTDKKVEQLKKITKIINNFEYKYEEDRQRLITANLPLVVSRAKKYSKLGIDLEDLIQEGNIGLLKAVDKFDPAMNAKVSTYAVWWIDQAIRRSISNKSGTIRIPAHIQQNLKKLNQEFFILSQKLRREPTMIELSEATGIPYQDEKNPYSLSTILGLQNLSLQEISLGSEFSEGVSYEDVIYDNASPSSFSEVASKLTRDLVKLAISELPPRYQKIIRLRFGIGEAKEHTFEEVGTKFNLSRVRIQQIQKAAIKKLKQQKRLTTAKE